MVVNFASLTVAMGWNGFIVVTSLLGQLNCADANTVRGSNSSQFDCVCVPFERCRDGDLIYFGADKIDIRFGSNDQCRGFDVCCNIVQPLFNFIEQTSSIRNSEQGGNITITMQNASEHVLASQESGDVAESGVVAHIGYITSGDYSSSELVPACVCMGEYLCEQGSLEASKAVEVDIRHLSRTGRCNDRELICCTVTLSQSQACNCDTSRGCQGYENGTATNGSHCSVDEIVFPDTNANQTEQLEIDTLAGFNHWTFCKSYPLSMGCPHSRKLNTLPTVKSAENFDPVEDAKTIRREFRIGGAIGNTLISVLVNRTYVQRHSIAQNYHRLYGNELYNDVSFWTVGVFEDIVQNLLKATSFVEFQAIMLYEAMAGLGTDEDAVIETLISSTPHEINDIKPIFERIAGISLDFKITSEFSGHVRDILLAEIRGERDRSNNVDPTEAKRQAKTLYKAGGAIYGTDEDTFKKLLTTQNYAQLALTMSEYQTLTGHSFEEAVESEFSSDLGNVLLAIVHVTRNVPRFFASRLRAILSNLRREDADLMRILISRSENDLATVVHEYNNLYQEQLSDRIEWKTVGNYENILLALIGSPEFPTN